MATARKRASQRFDTPRDSMNEFLDLAGHELRTPITALRGHVQLMQRRMRKQPERGADVAELNKMMYQIERLNHELDVFLEAAHITEKRFDLLPSECDVADIVQRLVSIYAGGNTGHTFRLETTPEQLVGTWDRRRVQMAVNVLLANAVKYSRSGEIDVRISQDGDAARVEVLDRGIGVPVGDRRGIFAPYTHAGNAENAGAGLGLYVARETIKRHHGKMGMRPRPGGGSIFWLTLPLGDAVHSGTTALRSATDARQWQHASASVDG